MKVNSLVIDFLIESIAVRIPTRAVIPTAMIRIVSDDLRRLERIELNDTLMFSDKRKSERILKLNPWCFSRLVILQKENKHLTFFMNI